MMQYSFVLVACAVFFGTTISAMESDEIANLGRTPKSTSYKAQPALEEKSAKEKLKEACHQVSEILDSELGQSGINTAFMFGDHVPSLEVVTKNMPLNFDLTTENNQNLLNLALYRWKFKKLSDTWLQVLALPNFIEAPIVKKIKGQSLLASTILATFTENCDLDTKNFTKQGNPLSLVLYGMYDFSRALLLSGPINFSFNLDGMNTNENCMLFCREIEFANAEKKRNEHVENSKIFEKMVNDHDNSLADKNVLLKLIYLCFEKAKSYRLNGFDPSTKHVPNDIIDAEVKLQGKILYSDLKVEYYQKILREDNQKPKNARQTGDEKDVVHKHKSTRKGKVEKDEDQKPKSTRRTVDEKDVIHKHKSTRKAKVEKDENQKYKSTLQTMIDFEIIKENAQKNALVKVSEYATSMKADKKRQFAKSYEQMDQLWISLENIPQFYGQAIRDKMKENKENILKSFSLNTDKNQ